MLFFTFCVIIQVSRDSLAPQNNFFLSYADFVCSIIFKMWLIAYERAEVPSVYFEYISL